jgi:3-hydroxybutyrate dehydrogenase
MSGKELEGRVAVVTGANGGLGRTLCSALHKAGASVLAVDLQGDDCLHVDVGTSEGNRQMIAEALDRLGRLDILVLNAGLQRMAPIAKYDEADWDQLMNVMARGPFLAMKYAWPALTARPGGRIIVTASTLGLVGAPFKCAYVAAKHAALGLVQVAALEGAAAGLTANAVAPSWVRTPLLENQVKDHMRLRGLSRELVLRQMQADQPAGRFVEATEVANVVVFLASPRSSGITGTCVPLDLGALAL